MNRGYVVIVEDDATFGAALKTALEKEGYTTFLTARCDEAETFLSSYSVNALFVDILLPSTSGVDFVDGLRKRFPVAVLDVVLMSGLFTDLAFIKDANRQTGALAYLKKPFDLADAVKLVKPTVTMNVAAEEMPPRKALYHLLSKPNVKTREKRKAIEALESVHGFDLPLLYNLLAETKSSGHLNIIRGTGEVMGVSFAQGSIVAVDIADQETQLGKLLIEAGFLGAEDLQDVLAVISPKKLGDRLIQGSFLSPHAFETALENQMKIRLARTISDAQITVNFVATEVEKTHPSVGGEELLVYIHDWVASKFSVDWLRTNYIEWSGSRILKREGVGTDHPVFALPLLMEFPNIVQDVCKEKAFDDFIEKNRHKEDVILKSLHLLLVMGLIYFEEKGIGVSRDDRMRMLGKIFAQIQGRNKLEILDILSRMASVTDGSVEKVFKEMNKILGPPPPSEDRAMVKIYDDITSQIAHVLDFAKSGDRAKIREEVERAEVEKKLRASTLMDEVKQNLMRGQVVKANEAMDKILAGEAKPDRLKIYQAWVKLAQLDQKQNKAMFLKEVEMDLLSVPTEDRFEAAFHFVMGLYQKARGENATAKRAFEKTLNLDSSFVVAKRELSLLAGGGGKKDVLNRDLGELMSGIFKRR